MYVHIHIIDRINKTTIIYATLYTYTYTFIFLIIIMKCIMSHQCHLFREVEKLYDLSCTDIVKAVKKGNLKCLFW